VYELSRQIVDMPTPFNMIVLIVLITSCAGIVTSIAKQIRKFAGQRSELNFKREMLDRGMEIEEIERILRAKSDSTS